MIDEMLRKIALNGYKLCQSDDFIHGRQFREFDEMEGNPKDIHEWDFIIQKMFPKYDYDEICKGYAFQDAVIAAR